MTNAAMNQMSIWEQKYNDVTELYALADELLATVPQAANPEAQFALVEALVETLGESTDVLTDEYIALCEGTPSRKKSAKSRIEGALRKVYVSLGDVSAKARDAKNAAHIVVKKIKRQLEQVISHFVEMVALSLDRIMQKNDVEELKAHHANIALMLYGAAKGQGQAT
ncbi:MAG: hypothetical protein V4735_07580 [Pseudomonadota bacterium]